SREKCDVRLPDLPQNLERLAEALPGRRLAPWSEVRRLVTDHLLESESLQAPDGQAIPAGIAGQLTPVVRFLDDWERRRDARLLLALVRAATATSKPLQATYPTFRALAGALYSDQESTEYRATAARLILHLVETKQVEQRPDGLRAV